MAKRGCRPNDTLEENQKGQAPLFKKRKKERFYQCCIKGRKQLTSWGEVCFAKLFGGSLIASLRWYFYFLWGGGLSFIPQNGMILAPSSPRNLRAPLLKVFAAGGLLQLTCVMV